MPLVPNRQLRELDTVIWMSIHSGWLTVMKLDMYKKIDVLAGQEQEHESRNTTARPLTIIIAASSARPLFHYLSVNVSYIKIRRNRMC